MYYEFKEKAPIDLDYSAMELKKGYGYSDEYLIDRNPEISSIEILGLGLTMEITTKCGFQFQHDPDYTYLEKCEETQSYNPCNHDPDISDWDKMLRTWYLTYEEYIEAFINRTNKDNNFNFFIKDDYVYSITRVYKENGQGFDHCAKMKLTPGHELYQLLLNPQT